MILQSIFGAYAENMQVMIDNSNARFAPTVFQRFFPFAPPQQSLTYHSVIGRARIEAAASVVDRDSKTPLRSRQGLEKLSGEIPAIKAMKSMSESDYREFLALQAIPMADGVKKGQILDFIFNDVKALGDGAMTRLDIFALQAISTGTIKIDINTNPDGLALANEIDLLMPAANKTNAAVSWATSATATPITDIETVVNAAAVKGVTFDRILMDRATFLLFSKAKEVVDSLVSYNALAKGAAVATLDKINEFLTANQFPVIEILEKPVAIEKDGLRSTLRPFETSNIAFVPSGTLGVMKNAVAIEQIKPVEKVGYASYNRALISKWSDNEPFQEFTKVEINAFPAFEAIDSVHILSHTKAF